MLKGLNGIKYKILYRGPSKLNISNSKEYIDTLPNNNLLDCDENMHYNRKILISMLVYVVKTIVVKNHKIG